MRPSVFLFASSFMALAACRAQEPVISAEVAPVTRPAPERPEREHYLGMAVPEHEPVPFPNTRNQCEYGQTRSCGGGIAGMPTMDGRPSRPLRMHCIDRGDGILVF